MTQQPIDFEAVFDAAVRIVDSDEREAYVRGACAGDDAAMRRIQKLLDAHFGAAGFLEAPAPGLPDDPPDEMTPGATVGPYTLVEQLGEGGMGVVFRAHQLRPVERDVALKIIKLGMDTRQVIARFDAERQALAVMDHPNVAKVFDAGATETGRPFFVMELVTGEPVTDFCDRHSLSIHDRLDLFVQICRAVQHAHHKGLIHRDIKPSNVLVNLQDGKPFAKVIDFGIAKATASRLTEKTLFTEERQLIGTPQYMSPEQAEGSRDIDTRTDIYSLGVLLYELLTGATPFDGTQLRSAAYGEMQRIIREVEPPRPSTRLSQNTATLASVAAMRRSEPRKLAQSVHGELDWIVMKALEKDRARRYESAAALATDILHHLADEPVSASPPSRIYLLRKLVRRHRAGVAASAAMVLMLVAGITGTTIGLVEARKQRDEARRQQQQATQQAAIAEAVSRFQSDMISSADPRRLLGDKVTVLQAVAAAVGELDNGRLTDQPAVEAAVRQIIGQTLRALGRYDQAEPNLRRAVELRRTSASAPGRALAEALAAMGNLLGDQEKFAEAEQLFTEALAIERATAREADEPRVAGALQNLGWTLSRQRKHERAIPMLREALQMRRRARPADDPELATALSHLGLTMWQRRELAEAEPLLREALEVNRRALPAGHPDLAMSLSNLALVLQNLQRHDEAEPLLRESLQISRGALPQGHPDLATPLNNLAHTLMQQSKLSEAEGMYRESLAIRRAAAASGAADPSSNGLVAASMTNLAEVLRLQNKMPEAQPLMRESLEIFRRALPPGHPTLGTALTNLGWSYLDEKHPAEAEPLLREALAIKRKELPPGHPETLAALGGLAFALQRQAKFAEAETLLLEAETINRGTKRHPRSVEFLVALYSEWDRAAPGNGYNLKASQWRQAIPATQPTTSP